MPCPQSRTPGGHSQHNVCGRHCWPCVCTCCSSLSPATSIRLCCTQWVSANLSLNEAVFHIVQDLTLKAFSSVPIIRHRSALTKTISAETPSYSTLISFTRVQMSRALLTFLSPTTGWIHSRQLTPVFLQTPCWLTTFIHHTDTTLY